MMRKDLIEKIPGAAFAKQIKHKLFVTKKRFAQKSKIAGTFIETGYYRFRNESYTGSSHLRV